MVGKTSISKRFITGKFEKIDLSNRTINTNIFQKCIEVNNKSFNLNIWDTAGEEKYHALGPIFYRGAQGAVVIFDVRNRETFERATRWFHELSEFAEGNPSMILVGNKISSTFLPKKALTSRNLQLYLLARFSASSLVIVLSGKSILFPTNIILGFPSANSLSS